MTQRRRLREGVTQSLKRRFGRFNCGGIKKIEQSFAYRRATAVFISVGVRYDNRVLIKQEAFVRWARQKARKVSIQTRVLSRRERDVRLQLR